MSEWIKIADREPERGAEVLLFFPREWSERRREWTHGAMRRVDHYPVGYPRKPTHWAAIPPDPPDASNPRTPTDA